MSLTSFKPNNKGKFQTEGGKRVFPPEWYAAQAARRKKKEDGTYKEGKFKTSTKAPDKELLPSKKTKREMPESWHKKQAERAKARKEAEAKGEYKRKVRGKARDYKDPGIDKKLKTGRRKIETDSYESASYAVSQLRKGDFAEIKHPKGSGRLLVKVTGFGFYPGTRMAVSGKGEVHKVDNNNIKASWVL